MSEAAGAASVAPASVAPASVAPGREPGRLEARLREQRTTGRKLLVPYLTGGLGPDWLAAVEAVAAAGADAIEVGLPFSDPMMDGPVIQQASTQALAGGATSQGILSSLAKADVGVPLAVMTYYNVVARAGHRRFASLLAESGVSAAILPDLPVDELDGWAAAADAAGIETVLLAAPTTPPARLRRIVARARGFVYAIGLMGVTGVRSELAASASEIAARCKSVTDIPVLVGVGVSTPAQAVEISQVADGVVVGSALVQQLLDGAGPEGAATLVREFRAALDG